jgi:hypothetical protein
MSARQRAQITLSDTRKAVETFSCRRCIALLLCFGKLLIFYQVFHPLLSSGQRISLAKISFSSADVTG